MEDARTGPIHDDELANVHAAMKSVLQHITNRDQKVCIHCHAGVNRSSLVAIAVMWAARCTLNETIDELILKLTNSKKKVNGSWHTLTNRRFIQMLRDHLCKEGTQPPGAINIRPTTWTEGEDDILKRVKAF